MTHADQRGQQAGGGEDDPDRDVDPADARRDADPAEVEVDRRDGRDGAVVDPEAGLGHFAPANWVEASQAAVYAPIA